MKFLKEISAIATALTLTACTSTVGNNTINEEGKLVSDQLDWPTMEDATQRDGIFPSQDELNRLVAGVTKKQLYRTIGRPHFQEIRGAKEWNYIFKFRKEDQTVKTCLFKVLFDKDKVAQNFYWSPNDCNSKQEVVTPQTYHLSADALFRFAKGDINNIRNTGKTELREVAKVLINNGNNSHVMITGHADRIGDARQNQRLSEQRANSVKGYLVSLGVDAHNIQTQGMGDSEPLVSCDSESGQALVDCLAPNRRVTITVSE